MQRIWQAGGQLGLEGERLASRPFHACARCVLSHPAETWPVFEEPWALWQAHL